MEENIEATARNEETTLTSAEPRSSGKLLPNDTQMTDKTCTRKLTNHTLEKQEQANGNMWWRKFVQYIKDDKGNRFVN